MADQVTVTWGKQLLSPIQYSTFELGPFSMTTTVGPEETEVQAMERAYAVLEAFARSTYKSKLAAFMEAHKAGQAAVRGR